jgi:hypothetical protein
MIRQQRYWVMDYETIVNCFVAVFTDYKGDEIRKFRIWKSINELPEFLEFLKENQQFRDWHFGYNNLSFDAQITQFIMVNQKRLLEMEDAAEVSAAIYEYAQYVIGKSRAKEFLDYPEWKLSIRVLDVFKINHWDNAQKRCALKWLQYQMDWKNVEEMPHPHNEPVVDRNTFDMVVDYCVNDVDSTKRVFKLSKKAIELRVQLEGSYDIPCLNWSNTKIGSELLLKLFCLKTGLYKKDVKASRTYRDEIKLKDVLFSYLKFKDTVFQDFLKRLNDLVIVNTKGDFKEVVTYKGYEFHYGLGGIHQCISKGIYKSDSEYIIIDADVASLYPSIAVVNKMYPKHLGPAFYEVYKNDIVDVRLAEKAKPKASRDMAIIDGFKEAANASYGNSNSEYSWLFDSQYTMQTTVNGQLMLTMLIEELLLEFPYAKLLQTNTDGFTLWIKRTDQERYYEICREWEKVTRLILEYADYDAMYIWDVNNYIAVYNSGETKCKGRFAWKEFDDYDPRFLHKNKSHLVVAKAIYQYFINGIVPEKYLETNTNILDYCAGVKLKGNWFFEELKVNHGVLNKTKHQKILRYFISNTGSKLIKVNPDGRQIQLESGAWHQTIMNEYVKKDFADYNVNKKYYLDKINAEIRAIQDGKLHDDPVQLSFF